MYDDRDDQIRELDSGRARLPLWVPPRRPQYLLVKIVSGQTLVTGQTGVKYKTSPVTSIPTAYDPSVDTTFIDGIGRGQLYRDGVDTGGMVLFLNDSTCPILRALVAGDFMTVIGPFQMPVDAGGLKRMYRGWFL